MDLSNDTSREKRVELILQQLEAVPPLADVAATFATVASSNAGGIADAVTALASNTAFAERVIKLSRAIDNAGPHAAQTVDSLFKKHGFEPLRSCVLAIGAYHTFAATTNNPEHWRH